jgi:hypothetical protein
LALDMMQQNLVVEALLNNYHNIFNRWFLSPWIDPSIEWQDYTLGSDWMNWLEI